MHKRGFSRKIVIQVEVSVDLPVGVRKPQLQWYCSLLNTDVLWSAHVSLCFCSGSVIFIDFYPSTLDNRMEAGESLVCCCLFRPQTSYEFLGVLFFSKLLVLKKPRRRVENEILCILVTGRVDLHPSNLKSICYAKAVITLVTGHPSYLRKGNIHDKQAIWLITKLHPKIAL